MSPVVTLCGFLDSESVRQYISAVQATPLGYFVRAALADMSIPGGECVLPQSVCLLTQRTTFPTR